MEQTRLLKEFERERIFSANSTSAEQRLHRGWTAELLAKAEALSLRLEQLDVEGGEAARLSKSIEAFVEDFRDTLLGYWIPRRELDPSLTVLGI